MQSSALRLVLAALVCTSLGARAEPLETIVVTAHRTPVTDSVLPIHRLKPDQAIGVDALRSLPSLAISQSGSLGSLTQIRVRGSEANHLLVLVDGFDIMDLTVDSGFNFANLNLAGMNSVEFLPGSQSAIWGNQALAGVLQFTTEPSEQVRRLVTERGSFDTGYGSAQLADSLERGYYNLTVSDFSTDGTNIARTGDETERYENTAYQAAAGWHGERFTLRALQRDVQTRSDFDPTPFPDYLPVDGDSVNTHNETLSALSLTLHGESVPWRQHIRVARFVTENSTVTDDAREAATDGRRYQLSSVTELPIGEDQMLIALLEHRDERFSQWGIASPFGDPNQRQSLDSTSAGLEYILRPMPRLRIAASGRYDRNSAFDDSDSLRLATHYAWRDDTDIWAAAGTGIKLPSFVERYGFTPDSFIGNPELEAERNEHLSLGVNHRSNGATHELTLFRDRLKNEINGFAFDFATFRFTAENENGTSKRAGVEWSSTWPWGNGSVRIGGSAINTEDPDGSREIRRPTWQVFTAIDQQWSRTHLTMQLYRVDEQVDQDFATYPAQRVDLVGYTLALGEITYDLGRGIRVGLRGSNLLDETWEDVLGYRSPGRAWTLRLEASL
ncbi:MAG: TonB-dependent receptor plug domain-containing protein [Pseudomonadales bacterium]